MQYVETSKAISIKGLRKSLDQMDIGPIDLEIESGYIVAIVGPNGAGKSTLFRLLMNLIKPDAGEIQLLGQTYIENEISIKQRIGYIPETEEWMDAGFSTIKELTQFVSHWYLGWNESKAQELFARFGLDGKQKLRHLSKGMKRKLAFIHAMAFDPDILFLDEPTSGLDPFAWRMMMEDLMAYMERGDKTVLLATHIIDEVKRMADYVAFIHDGKLMGFYEKDVLFDSWKTLWIEGHHDQLIELSGVVAVEELSPATATKVISRSSRETEADLHRLGVKVIQTQSVELDEILGYLISGEIRKVG
ncbi:ABC transporter ATP-binding protein [Paenibacillus sp. SYP-B3998]|uniref:ABC transporter ATP-binding protein n=1 Tax=Paenibacillus sp. SYP-B3998 TaxID=2678564 RepID=A0A6G3ZXW6_9BACL|nr:ABC transporter ATP-binding protein [Paenibacillus sp. SYP-B3998]NEW06955.1 ABC transporter ATP-binding protein [Paenibacillus sp. SYP-B3998]